MKKRHVRLTDERERPKLRKPAHMRCRSCDGNGYIEETDMIEMHVIGEWEPRVVPGMIERHSCSDCGGSGFDETYLCGNY